MIARTVIENVASALSDNHGVKVIFRGGECHTNGKTIVLPSLPDKLPGPLVEMIRGYLDHEVAHILFSDFRLLKKATEIGRKDKSHLKFVFNAVEDIRIELKMAEVYKGSGINFKKSRDLSIEKLKERLSAADSDPILKAMLFFIVVAQTGWDHPFVIEYGDDIMPLLEHLADEIEASKHLPDCKAALSLAEKILTKIDTFMETPPPMPKGKKPKMGGTPKPDAPVGDTPEAGGDAKVESSEGTPGGSASSEDETSDPAGSGTEDESGETTSDEDEDKTASEKSDEAEEPEAEPDKTASEDEDDVELEETSSEDEELEDEDEEIEDPHKELKERIKESLDSPKEKKLPGMEESISEEAGKMTGWRPYSTEKDTFDPHPEGKIDQYNELSRSLNGVVTTLRGRLSRILLSQKRSKWAGGKMKGIINPCQLHQIITKTSDAVYRIHKDGIKMNTAVSILVDLSGSMGHEGKIRTARETTTLLAETLKRIGIPFEILGFSGDHSDFSRKMPYHDRAGFSGRWGSLDMYYFKTFDENFGQIQKQRIAGMTAHHQNYDGDSVMFAAKRLKQRPERKKILFVLSDGEPAAACCDATDVRDHLHQVATELDADPSLTLVAFGMLTDAPAKYYQNHIVVNDIASFPETLMQKLYKQLV